MTRVHTFALALLCISLPGMGSAAELHLTTTTSINFDTREQRVGDLTRLFLGASAPVEIRTWPSSRSKATFRYTPYFEFRPTGAASSRWNHSVGFDGSYNFSRRLSASASIKFDDIGFIGSDTAPTADNTLERRGGSRRTSVALQTAYSLSKRSTLSGFLNYQRAVFEGPDRNDSQSVSGGIDLVYRAGRRDTFGLGIQPSFSRFDASLRSQGQEVTSLRANFRWTHEFSKAWKLSVSAGPSLSLFDPVPFPDVIESRLPFALTDPGDLNSEPLFFLVDDDSGPVEGRCKSTVVFSVGCQNPELAVVSDGKFADPPGLTPDEARALRKPIPILPGLESSERQLNYFGSVALSYEISHWKFNARYRRSESNDSGFGSSSAVDSLSLDAGWQPSRRWSLSLGASASKRTSLTENARPTGEFFIESAGDSTIFDANQNAIAERKSGVSEIVSQPVNRQEAFVRIFASRVMTRHLSLKGDFSYGYQDRKGTFDGGSQGSLWRVGFGLRYSFDPVRF